MEPIDSTTSHDRFAYHRLPKDLQGQLARVYHVQTHTWASQALAVDEIHEGDARDLLNRITPNSVALSVWSPPYFVGKSYEANLTFDDWQSLLATVIVGHWAVIRPGGFLAINIADILCFRDSSMPKISAQNAARRSSITREMVLAAIEKHPDKNRYQLAKLLGCSEQTIDRRLNGNNIRGGKYETQTRLQIVGGLVEGWARKAGFYPYDRRVWAKDPAWENSRWASLSYRAVDEFEYIYVFWKPGITTVDRGRLTASEWREWGSRGVWSFPSVRANDDHEAKFPVELPRRVIKLLTAPGDTVLDCFMGSGTTAVAAMELQRHYIGIELERRYTLLARRRIAAAIAAGREPIQCSLIPPTSPGTGRASKKSKKSRSGL